MSSNDLDLSLLGLEPGKHIWGQLGKSWWPGRVSFPFPTRLGDSPAPVGRSTVGRGRNMGEADEAEAALFSVCM